ncbi:hypothetical protein [Aquimarina sp. MMG016]|uniref:hypothetical protein n=1 Tax=Aquimarina sp. MMG016 TaxID=2822690 RepID=UPI001B3A213D|nr:hypothetical protein [Aquimarina sp. MMG016]MBQ4822409.1 hypothetical protein [Aquimarina sp. MMG016]
MKSTKKLITLLSLMIITFFTSCSEEDVLEELTGGCVPLSAVESYSNALERYSSDPTIENCEVLKAASINYLNTLDSCPLIDDQELRQALQEASETNCED